MTTYWLKGRKVAPGGPNPRPLLAVDGVDGVSGAVGRTENNASGAHAQSVSTSSLSASPLGAVGVSSPGSNRVIGNVDKLSTVNESLSVDSLSSKHTLLQQSASNSSQVSSASHHLGKGDIVTRKCSDGSTEIRVPQSPTSSLRSSPRSPSEIVRAIDQEHAQRIDMQMSMPNMPTPPGSLSRRRNHNIDSPRDSRNPLKKIGSTSFANCISSQGPPSECSSTYMRVDSPELPAVHFRNLKMSDGDERNSRAIQNDLFDSLKVGHDAKYHDKMQKKKKPLAQRSSSNPLDADIRKSKEINAMKTKMYAEAPPPVPVKQRESFPGYASVSYDSIIPTTSANSHNTKPQVPRPMSSEHGRPIVPYQVSNPIVPRMQQTPLVLAGVVSPLARAIRPAPCQSPRSVNPPGSLFFNGGTHALRNELASIDEVPPEERRKRTSMFRELERTVNPSEPNKFAGRPVRSTPQSTKGEATYSVINKQKPAGQAPCKEQFVTATYREPIAASSPSISPVPTPPPRVASAQQRSTPRSTPQTTPKSFGTPPGASHQPAIDHQHLTRLPPLPTSPDNRRNSTPAHRTTHTSPHDVRRISDGSQKSSNSSHSTITPTNGSSANPLVASIDGRTMSLLPASPEELQREEERLMSILKRSPSDSSKEKANKHNSVPQVKRSNSSPRAKHRVFPIQVRKDIMNNLSSQSDNESEASHQQSENSSVVLLQPIELKLARPAFVRQISHPDHHVKNFINQSNFYSPKLTRHMSRSSDTINSIPRGQQTPKFPLVTAESTSLTQLLKQLASEHPTLDLSLPKDLSRDNFDSDLDDDVESNHMKTFSEYDSLLNGDCYYIDDDEHSVNNKKQKSKDKSSDKSKSAKTKDGQGADQNPFQVKRRHNYTIPPRYCRSLDYIPSDREDQGHSNQSSACGSPESKHKQSINSYMLPFFTSGVRNPLGIASISVSSIASSSEMSRSDPALHTEVGSSAYESEYDNYRPGMLSDEDYFHTDPVSDIDVEMFDDVNVDDVTVSDHYSLDLPPLASFPKKKITDV